MKVLLFVATGQLGTGLRRIFEEVGDQVIPKTRADVDACSEHQSGKASEETKLDCRINTAAFHKVEECEKQLPKRFW